MKKKYTIWTTFYGRLVVWSKNKVYLYNIKRRDMCNNLKQKKIMNEVFRPLSVGDQVKFLLFNEDEVVTLTCTGTCDETATLGFISFIDKSNKEFYMDECEVLYAKNGEGEEIGTRFYEDSEREYLYVDIIDYMGELSYEQLHKIKMFIKTL